MKKKIIIDEERKNPIRQLWTWLRSLQSVVNFMQTGAHPDDETSRLLAKLSLGYGMHVIYVNAVRGQGGQNALGPERGDELGYLRSEEMLEAMKIIRADLGWLSQGPRDPIRDFNFSKSAEETFKFWGKEYTLRQMVKMIRKFKPDVIIPTFLDVPGQHGHHRAITKTTIQAFYDASDDSKFMELDLLPWKINALYLPAWGGGGGSYDDEKPPPKATHKIETEEYEKMFGGTFSQIGEWSRGCHATQGMGNAGGGSNKFVLLHQLLTNSGEKFFDKLTNNVPENLADLSNFVSSSKCKEAALKANKFAKKALSTFPNEKKIIKNLCSLMEQLQILNLTIDDDHKHRIELKIRQASMAASLASRMQVKLQIQKKVPVVGRQENVVLSWYKDKKFRPKKLEAKLNVTGEIECEKFKKIKDEKNKSFLTAQIRILSKNPLPLMFETHALAVDNNSIKARVSFWLNETKFNINVLPENPITSFPEITADLSPNKILIPIKKLENDLIYNLNLEPHNSNYQLDDFNLELPKGFFVKEKKFVGDRNITFILGLDKEMKVGRYKIKPMINDQEILSYKTIGYNHIREQTIFKPAASDIIITNTKELNEIKIGWIDGGVDNAWYWAKKLGADIMFLEDDDLLNGNLDKFDVIVSGVFAGYTRPLNKSMHRLVNWMNNGGRYVSEYHRPKDNWNPNKSSPYYLNIGSPSIRWRVTDPNAPVEILKPNHLLFTTPNSINEKDFDGWVKERGLYFASEWSENYDTLISLSDQGEKKLEGSILYANVGKGSHVHCALNLFYQMDNCVIGAFRIFENLLYSKK